MSDDEEEYSYEEPKSAGVMFLPTVKEYMKLYAKNMDGNDQKAVAFFKSYESQEKVRRLQAELILLKEGQVDISACDNIVGKKRSSKYGSYEKWGSLMLVWLAEAKKF